MKKCGHLGAVKHFGHQGPSLSNAELLFVRDPPCSLWIRAEAGELGTIAGQDVVWTATNLAQAVKQAGPKQHSAN